MRSVPEASRADEEAKIDAPAERLLRGVILLAVVVSGLSAAHAIGPQGRIVYRGFEFDADPAVDVYIVGADGSKQRPLVRDQTAFTAMWSGDGRVAAWLNDDDALFTMDADGTNRQRVPDGRFPRDWSSDGEWFATVHYERGVGVDVAKHRVDGSDYQVLTAEGFSQINSIEWSRDGRKLVFSARNGGGVWQDIYTVDADGNGLTNLTNHVSANYDEHWSADGRRVYFESQRDAGFDLYVMDADGRGVRRLDTDARVWDLLATSPDGKYLLVARKDLHILDTDGRHISQVTDDELWPRQGDWHIPRSILPVSPFGKRHSYWGWLKASSLRRR